MASEMAFSIFGAGYGGFSVGTAFIALKINGKKLLYKSTLCQGMSTSIVYSIKPFEIKNDVSMESTAPPERFLQCMQGFPVKIKLEGSFINPMGDYGDFTLEIYNPNRSDPIYKTSRKPMVGGICAGGVSVLSTFAYCDLEKQLNMRGNMMDSSYAADWEEVWNGKKR